MIKRIFISLLIAATLYIPSSGGTGTQSKGNGMWNDLQLTAEQRTQIAKLHTEREDSRDKNITEIKTVRQKIRDELVKSNPSRTLLADYANELGKLHSEQMLQSIDRIIELKAILTPEQTQKLIDRQWKGDGIGKDARMMGDVRMGKNKDSADCNHGKAKGPEPSGSEKPQM